MIKIENLTKTYNYKKSNAFTALTDVSLTVEDCEMLAIIGKSGAGKSTLLHIIGCIDTFEKGTYTLDDISVHKLSDKKLAQIRNQKVGIVMQDFALVYAIFNHFSTHSPRPSKCNCLGSLSPLLRELQL